MNIRQKRLLIIKNDGLGDLILASGLITELTKIFQGNVDLVTCIENKEIVELMPKFNSVFYISRDSLKFIPLLWRIKMFLPLVNKSDRKELKKLEIQKYDIAISLRRFIRQNTFIVMQYVNSSEKYCFWEYPTNLTLNSAKLLSKSWFHIKGNHNVKSELIYYQDLLEKIFKLQMATQPRLNIKTITKNIKNSKSISIGISGGSTNWDKKNWIALCKKLCLAGYNLSIFGGKDYIKLGETIKKIDPLKIENFVGNLTFDNSVNYLQNSSIYVGNDTGFSHFASLIVDKCFIIMGGGTFNRFFPWSSGTNQYLIYNKLKCFDCFWNCNYAKRHCLSLITHQDVLDWVINESNSFYQKKLLDLNKTIPYKTVSK